MEAPTMLNVHCATLNTSWSKKNVYLDDSCLLSVRWSAHCTVNEKMHSFSTDLQILRTLYAHE
jgi:hypothetical protein